MGAYLHTLKRFRVSTELTGERVLADGQKLQHTATTDMDVERPNKIRAWMHSARPQRELIYDGANVTLYTAARKYYSTVAFSGTLAELVKRLEERYAVPLPLSGLFLWGTAAAPVDKIESAMNAGQDFVDEELCDHYAFRGGGGAARAHVERGGGARQNLRVNNSKADARVNNVRSTSVNNMHNVNVDRNVNVNVENRRCCGWDNDHHAVATAAAVGATVAVTSAVVGSIVRSVPSGCVAVNYGGMVYQQCGSTWYAPQGSQYRVVNPPY